MIEECSDLDITITDFIIPRLVWYIEHNKDYPMRWGKEYFDDALLKILNAFEIHYTGYYYPHNMIDEDVVDNFEFRNGMKLFAEMYPYLWM